MSTGSASGGELEPAAPVDRETLVDDVPIAVVDVETTGLRPELGDRVCEVAVLRVEPRASPRVYASLVNPGRPIRPEARAVNGIADGDVAGAPTFAALLPDVSDAIGGAVLVAHNVPFDLGFLRAEYGYAGASLYVPASIDTLELARRHFRFARNDLGTVARALGVTDAPGHRAEADARVTWQVFVRMKELLVPRGLRALGDYAFGAGAPACGDPEPSLPLPDALVVAIETGRAVYIRYEDGWHSHTDRLIEPRWAGGPYVRAYCHLRRDERTFRLDRVIAAWWPDAEGKPERGS